MSKKFPLQTLLDLSQTRLDDAARLLGQLMANEKEATQRLDLLIQYRSEYHERFLASARNGVSQEQWRNFQGFLARLDTAVGQAQEAVRQSKHHTANGQQHWLTKRGEVKAYDTLAERFQQRQHYAEQRREQKALDEHTSRRFHQDRDG
ncbi:MAG: flagellar export protein FliJ [Rhodocyclaceae bacterium]|nr:MAG: flagellar export protein FliJ [Rhodocyclaceae bacterium]